MTIPFGRQARALFSLDPQGTFLNHGSFGAVPIPVQQAQQRWQAAMERQPDLFFRRLMKPAIRAAAEVLGPVVNVNGDDIAFVENATSAINAVLHSLTFRPGDEILITSTTYNTVRLAVVEVCKRSGATPVVVDLPLPLHDHQSAVSRVEAKLSRQTRLAIFDLIVSPTAHILPVREMTKLCKQQGAKVLIDAAHGPGQVPLDIQYLGADWVTGNLHKWLFCPRGTAFFWAGPQVRDLTAPLAVSHWLEDGFPRSFDYTGTRDATAWLCVPDALSFIAEFGMDAMMAHNSTLVRDGVAKFARLGARPTAEPGYFAAMQSMQLPTIGPASPDAAVFLLHEMWDQHRVQIAASIVDGALLLRLSGQIYCATEDFTHAADALDALGWPGRP